jgi:hypothetical protein
MKNLYDKVTTTAPPKWLGDAGDAAYEGMDNAFKAIGKKLKKKRKGDVAKDDKKNALDV